MNGRPAFFSSSRKALEGGGDRLTCPSHNMNPTRPSVVKHSTSASHLHSSPPALSSHHPRSSPPAFPSHDPLLELDVVAVGHEHVPDPIEPLHPQLSTCRGKGGEARIRLNPCILSAAGSGSSSSSSSGELRVGSGPCHHAEPRYIIQEMEGPSGCNIVMAPGTLPPYSLAKPPDARTAPFNAKLRSPRHRCRPTAPFSAKSPT